MSKKWKQTPLVDGKYSLTKPELNSMVRQCVDIALDKLALMPKAEVSIMLSARKRRLIKK